MADLGDLALRQALEKREAAVKDLGQTLRNWLADWGYIHPQEFDTEDARHLARDILEKFSR